MSRDVGQATTPDRYRNYEAPPAGFDPHTASDRELRRHGLPRHPDPESDPDLAREWSRVFAQPIRFVRADFSPGSEISPLIPLDERLPGRWAGGAVRQGQPFKWVFAEWTIPNVETNKSLFDPAFALGFWVGMDGITIGNDQVLQAGVAVQVVTKWQVPSRFIPIPLPRKVVTWYAWSEWWTLAGGEDAVPIKNFPVKPGDMVSFIVCAPDPDDDIASIFARNVTTGLATAFGIKAPLGYVLTGDAAEWMVEPKGKLARFDPVTFRECLAGKPTFGVAPFLGSVYEINLTDVTGKELIHVELDEPRSVTVTWTAG